MTSGISNKLQRAFLIAGCILSASPLFSQVEQAFQENKSPTYEETITAYRKLAEAHPMAFLIEYGTTDAGIPLHMLLITKDQDVDPVSLRKRDKRIILINNAIHAGEPCGVDASIKFAQDLLNKKISSAYLDNVIICIIPGYNIGGMQNRNSTTRVNQDGPQEYGFRGNARNFDLNRDFIKADSKNARTFAEIYHTWRPDIFVDTHTTNGADYPYTMTLIPTHPDKIHPLIGTYMRETMLPELYKSMNAAGVLTTPYVNSIRQTPDDGIAGFLDSPRYSTGYTSLFNTIGFITEAHMLKPYNERVMATYTFLVNILKFTSENGQRIGKVRGIAAQEDRERKDFALSWKLDSTRSTPLMFKGYTAGYKPSDVTGKDRLYYDREQPYEKAIPFYDTYRPADKVTAPVAYIIPQAWKEVIDLLKANKVTIQKLTQDMNIPVSAYYVEDYQTVETPFEGHYLHYNIKTRTEAQRIDFKKDDYVVYLNQSKNRFLIEVLEPRATDSYFAWNFFDVILAQKEHFSPYVFEDLAAKYLAEHPDIKQQLDLKKLEDDAFAESPYQQLLWVYRQTPHYEAAHLRYPIFRLDKETTLPVKYE
ncbi:MAG: hypothetical protein KDD36_09790 [Flavobacteriales bacterium]|nr:hypothetical protein [Flavobacteriales bacterium]